jgi:Leucine-rich repeat (LRR) protein
MNDDCYEPPTCKGDTATVNTGAECIEWAVVKPGDFAISQTEPEKEYQKSIINKIREIEISSHAYLRRDDNGGPKTYSLNSKGQVIGLNLVNCGCEYLSKAIREFPLQNLILRNNRLSSLPEWLKDMSTLKVLDVSDNWLNGIPEWICNLTGLKELCLADNNLFTLPKSMENFTSLTILSLCGNRMLMDIEPIGDIKSLVRLDLSYCNIKELPDSLSNLTMLTKLNLRGNQLTSLPDWITDLTMLTKLNLRGNQLTSLPKSIRHLRLVSLDLQYNQLTSIPEELLELELEIVSRGTVPYNSINITGNPIK